MKELKASAKLVRTPRLLDIRKRTLGVGGTEDWKVEVTLEKNKKSGGR